MHHCFLIIEVVVVTQLTADVLFHVSSFVFNWIGVLRFCWLIHSCNTAAFKHWSAVVSVWPGVVVNPFHVGRSFCPRNKSNGYLFLPYATGHCDYPELTMTRPSISMAFFPKPTSHFQQTPVRNCQIWLNNTHFTTDHRFLRIGGICWISMCTAVISLRNTQKKTVCNFSQLVWKILKLAPCTFQVLF